MKSHKKNSHNIKQGVKPAIRKDAPHASSRANAKGQAR